MEAGSFWREFRSLGDEYRRMKQDRGSVTERRESDTFHSTHLPAELTSR